MATSLVLLLRQAHEIGITVSQRPDRTIAIRTKASTVTVARALRTREADLAQLHDWSHAAVRDPEPCVLCGRPAILRDPVESRPCHKVCVDALLRTATPTDTP